MMGSVRTSRQANKPIATLWPTNLTHLMLQCNK
jgi:hypothetical protein